MQNCRVFSLRRASRDTVFLAAVFVLASCAPRPPVEHSRTEFVLGTACTLRLMQGGDDKLLDTAFARLRQIEDELTVNKPGSEIDAVNAAAGKRPIKSERMPWPS